MPIHELVRYIRRHVHLPSLRLSSLAGQGMTERIRSTGFALLGLTAAASLALVAIFALPGYSLLAPAPLPDGPTATQSIGGAERALPGRASRPLAAAVAPGSSILAGAGGAPAPGP